MSKKIAKASLTLLILILVTSVAWGNSLSYKGDIISFFKDVSISRDTVVKGTIVSIFGDVSVKGIAEADVVTIFGRVEVEGTVRRDVVSIFGGITVTPGGTIERNATAILGHGIINNGAINRDITNILGFFPFGVSPMRILLGLLLLLTVIKQICAFILSVIAIVIMPDRFERMTVNLNEDMGKRAVVGILTYIAAFVLAVVLIMIVLGAPIVALLIPAFMLLEFAGNTTMKIYIGKRISSALDKNWTVIMALLLGTVIYTLLELILIGRLLTFIFKLIGMGEIIHSRFGSEPRSPIIQAGGFNPTKGDDEGR